ncbi:serine hydrolase domain-containing protein [Polaribacter sp.]|uniref:serine hydrolase domain-containing protein n=1 Tax=Polaribacter sp. TaxID=1920175 RepID=UPI003EF56556
MINNSTLVLGKNEDVGFIDERLELIKKRAEEWVENNNTSALTYLIARKGVIVSNYSFGRLKYDIPTSILTPDAVFSLSSCSKPVIATLAMILVEDGILSLTRPVTDYIPELKNNLSSGVMVGNLLTHTSGYNANDWFKLIGKLPYDIPRDQVDCELNQHPYIHSMLELCYSQLKPRCKPGRIMMYCGFNYILVSEIVRRLSSKSLNEFSQEFIFTPLEMKSSWFGLKQEAEDARVTANPKIYEGTGRDPNNFKRLTIPHASGGLISNSIDMAKFCQMFLNGGCYGDKRILSRSSIDIMTQNQIPNIKAKNRDGLWIHQASRGYGWAVQSEERWKYINGSLIPINAFHHEGSFGVGIWGDPKNELVGVFLSSIRTYDVKTDYYEFNLDLFQNMVYSALQNNL